MKKSIIFLLLFLSINSYASIWNCINRSFIECNTWRMEVYGGWIVASDNPGGGIHGYAMNFIPDPEHKWSV